MLTDAAAIAAAERIKAQAGAIRAHRLGEPDELTEEAMPRKASTEPKPEPTTRKKRGRPAKAKPEKPARKPRQKLVMEHVAGPRFGVFDDGSVTLALPGCKGQMVPEEARDLVAFLAKLGVKA